VQRREFRTTVPPDGDYTLSPTGLTWIVRRSNGDGSAQSVAIPDGTRPAAMAALLALAEADKTNAWETVGTGFSWLIKRWRPAA
jgi:hypothetical protein